MVSSGILRRVIVVRTDVSEEPGASFIRATRIGEVGTTQAATSNRRTLRNIPEDTILHSHRRENLKSYTECGHGIIIITGTTALCEPWPRSKLFAILPYLVPHSSSSLHPGF
jgi:hypothetical protein